MAFDREAAKKAGYSDSEIDQFIANEPPPFDVTADQFDVEGALKAGYTEQEIADHLAKNNIGQIPSQEDKVIDFLAKNRTPEWKRTAMDMTRTGLEGAGMLGGAAIGGGAGILTAPFTGPVGATAGAIAGGTLGYAGLKKTADIIEELFGMKKPAPLGEQMVQTGKDLGTGAFMTATGEAGGLALTKALPLAGTFVKDIWGRLTGKGREAIAAAYRNSPDFRLANQGKLTGEQIVDNSVDVLQNIVKKTGAEYSAKLQAIKTNPALLNQVRSDVNRKLSQLASPDEFAIDIAFSPTGEIAIDFSNSSLVKNQDVIGKAIKDITTLQDTSAAGLDVLKKRLGTYMGQVERKTPPHKFLSSLYNETKTGLEGAIPEYANMTKPYADAMQLIQDLESGLMLKKVSGRVTADNTLRRLMSALRDNFEMRGDLLKTLSTQDTNVLDQVAGYAMKDWLPSGLMGSGPGLIGQGFMLLNPKMWPIVAAASPKISTKFLQIYGGMARTASGSQNLLGQYGMFTKQKVQEQQ